MHYLETLKNILGERVDVSNIKETDLLADLGLDSLDLVEVVLEIEEKLNIEFNSDQIASLKTIQDVLQLIEEKTK